MRALGKDPAKAHVIAGHVWLVVANDPDKTWHELAPHVLYQINLYAKWMGDSGQDFFPHMNSVEELRKSGLLNVATPERAVETDSRLRLAHSDRALLHLDSARRVIRRKRCTSIWSCLRAR